MSYQMPFRFYTVDKHNFCQAGEENEIENEEEKKKLPATE